MSADVWEECLASYLDRALQLATWNVASGRLPDRRLVWSASANMQSAKVHPKMISGFFSSELRAEQVGTPDWTTSVDWISFRKGARPVHQQDVMLVTSSTSALAGLLAVPAGGIGRAWLTWCA